jgi:hypothetical protein
MKLLLNHELAPLTFSWGFLKLDLQTAGDFLASWRKTHLHTLETAQVAGSLREMLGQLQPLTVPRRKELIVETGSEWTAYFDNGAKGADPVSTMGHMTRTLKCWGLTVSCVPHTLTKKDRNAKGTYGAVQFELLAPEAGEFLNYERTLGAVNDGGRWVFDAVGTVQPYEKPEHYSALKVRDRFTDAMLEEYCLALGIRLFDPEFYGPAGLLLTTHDPLPAICPRWTLQEAQDYFGIRPPQARTA